MKSLFFDSLRLRFAMRCLLAGVASALSLFFVGCGKTSEPSSPDKGSILPLAKDQVLWVKTEERPSLNEVVGTIRPAQRALIAAKLMGTIEEMPVTLGQRVRKGDLLLKISAGEKAAQLLQAQSQLNQARRDLDTARQLFGKGATTSDSVHALEDRLAMTDAIVREAEVMLGYTSIRAPFDGVISRKIANAGDLASPGTSLLEVEGSSMFQVEAGIPDSLSSSLTIGSVLNVEIPAVAVTLEGKLIELSSAADPAARTVPAKISLPDNPAVRSGLFARVSVPGKPIRVMLVPESAVVRQGQIEGLFVVGDQSRVVLRIVKTGALREGRREVLAGLSDGDRILCNPPIGLREGQKLEVKP